MLEVVALFPFVDCCLFLRAVQITSTDVHAGRPVILTMYKSGFALCTIFYAVFYHFLDLHEILSDEFGATPLSF